ncbi:uncharacterized protein LOC141848972 isoform X2 [Brevipalpus obovatus]|uniref:uncharacterized protein LOC141848972 isoform X2 n=1 Tax=Brevipalpus obovatus TaxID=246614 RepID=UPI003D9DCDEB
MVSQTPSSPSSKPSATSSVDTITDEIAKHHETKDNSTTNTTTTTMTTIATSPTSSVTNSNVGDDNILIVANGKNCSSNSNGSTKLDANSNPLPSVNEMIFEDNPGVHRKPLFAYKSNEEYLYAMKEDLAEWLNNLYNLSISEENFIPKLETGAVLCRHANNVISKAKEAGHKLADEILFPSARSGELPYRDNAKPKTFQARDNVSNFISWCRLLKIHECLLFETDDLVLGKNEKSFVLCLLEVCRKCCVFGVAPPLIIQMEQEIDHELDQELNKENQTCNGTTTTTTGVDCGTQMNGKNASSKSSQTTHGKNLEGLHDRVIDMLNICSCPSRFPMIKVADGKYRIGDTRVLIFVRILRNHVMVRVGGGWDTLGHYLDRHDPCRCRSGHRFSTSAKLTFTGSDSSSGPQMIVTYDRPEDPMNLNSLNNNNNNNKQVSTPSSTLPHNFRRRTSSGQTGLTSSESFPNGHSLLINSRSSPSKNHPQTRPESLPVLTNNHHNGSNSCDKEMHSNRQDSRNSHYSDDSTDNSSVIMESPPPTHHESADGKNHPNSSTASQASASSSPLPSSSPSATGTIRRNIYIDSSSSEISENEMSHIKDNSGSITNGDNSPSRTRKCSPRKIMRTNDLLGPNRVSRTEKKKNSTSSPGVTTTQRSISAKTPVIEESEEPKSLPVDFKVNSTPEYGTKIIPPFVRNSDSRSSFSRVSRIPCIITHTRRPSKTRSDEDLSKNVDISWKTPQTDKPRSQSIVSSNSCSTNLNCKAAASRRQSTSAVIPASKTTNELKEHQTLFFQRGSNRYTSLPRNRSQAQTPSIDRNERRYQSGRFTRG